MYLEKAGLSQIDVAQRAKVSLPTVNQIVKGGDKVLSMRMATLMRVSMALGCATAELVPQLAQRPNKGLLWERRVFREKKR